MVLEQDCLGVQWWGVLAEEESLNFNELNVVVFFTRIRFRSDLPVVRFLVAL